MVAIYISGKNQRVQFLSVELFIENSSCAYCAKTVVRCFAFNIVYGKIERKRERERETCEKKELSILRT